MSLKLGANGYIIARLKYDFKRIINGSRVVCILCLSFETRIFSFEFWKPIVKTSCVQSAKNIRQLRPPLLLKNTLLLLADSLSITESSFRIVFSIRRFTRSRLVNRHYTTPVSPRSRRTPKTYRPVKFFLRLSNIFERFKLYLGIVLRPEGHEFQKYFETRSSNLRFTRRVVAPE